MGGSGPSRANLEKLQAVRPDLGEHAVKCCLIGQRSPEDRLDTLRLGLEVGKRTEHPLA